MTIESNTFLAVSDPTTLAADVNRTVRPALEDLGASEVTAALGLTGQMTGVGVLTARWSSLDTWAAATAEMATRMAPGGSEAELADRYQVADRMLSSVLHDAGEHSGAFLCGHRYSFGGAPVGLEESASAFVAAGATSMRFSEIFAGGMTGQVFGAMSIDSLDNLTEILAATSLDSQAMTALRAAGGKLETRVVLRVV